MLRAYVGLHVARQGAWQPASLVQAARAVISRRQQRRRPEPVGGAAEHPLRRERDRKQPLFHIGGLNVNSIVIWQKGGHIVLHRNFDATRCLDDIARYRITTLFGVPAAYCAPLFDAASAHGIASVVTASDLEAGYAADGYARTKGLGAPQLPMASAP